MAYNLPHPEMRPGEVWWSNLSDVDFQDCPFETKRLGEVAYDDSNIPTTSAKPCFVMRQELVDKGVPIPMQDGAEYDKLKSIGAQFARPTTHTEYSSFGSQYETKEGDYRRHS